MATMVTSLTTHTIIGIVGNVASFLLFCSIGNQFACTYTSRLWLSVLICITLLAFHTHALRSTFVGIFYVIFGILFYCAPLTVMHKVITTKRVKYMPLCLSIAGLINGAVWSAYACTTPKFDYYILVCNSTGAILSILQLGLYVFYSAATANPQQRGLELTN
uniref:Uncharacterized protein n=1 Tax=Chenopodium quinoa TaxID=63459 RepID=A0A803M3B4_CHEQI